MVYQIDQSGKVEQTERITVVAFSNDKYGSISLSSKIKKDILPIFRKTGKPKMFSIQTFAALVFLLLKKYKINDKKIIIDKEYPGHENLIKSYILQLAKSTKSIKLNSGSIEFKLIGKSSNAHDVAYKSFKRKGAEHKVSFNEIKSLISKYKKSGN